MGCHPDPLLDSQLMKSFLMSVFLKHHAVAAFTIPSSFSIFAVVKAQRKPVRISEHLPAFKHRVLFGSAYNVILFHHHFQCLGLYPSIDGSLATQSVTVSSQTLPGPPQTL